MEAKLIVHLNLISFMIAMIVLPQLLQIVFVKSFKLIYVQTYA